MAAQQFAEVIGNPYKAWVGAVGIPQPFPDDAESAFDPGWKVLGTNGINNQGTGGVTVGIGRTMSHFTPAGGTLPVKSTVTDEAITVGGSIVDTTIEQLSLILDAAAITTVAASSGHGSEKQMSLVRGVAVKYFAVLVRGISPYDDGSGLTAQYHFARVFQSANQSLQYLKGNWTDVAWQFTIAGTVNGEDPALYRAQTGPHS